VHWPLRAGGQNKSCASERERKLHESESIRTRAPLTAARPLAAGCDAARSEGRGSTSRPRGSSWSPCARRRHLPRRPPCGARSFSPRATCAKCPPATVKTDFSTGETRQPVYLGINPNGHILALDDGGVVLWESMALNLSLARKYDTGLWPRTLADEGRAFQRSLGVMTEAEEPVITALLHRRVFPEAQRRAAKAADAGERFKKRLAVLEGALAGRPYLLGEAFTVADLNVASVLAWAPLAGLDLAGAPHANDWLRRCTGRPALARAQRA